MDEYNRNLFRYVNLYQLNAELLVDIQYYILRNGVVYEISKETLEEVASGDSPENLLNLEHLGSYDTRKVVNYLNGRIKVSDIFALVGSV